MVAAFHLAVNQAVYYSPLTPYHSLPTYHAPPTTHEVGCRDHSQARRRNNAAAPPPPSSARAFGAASRGPLPRHPTLALTLNLTYPNLTLTLP